MEESLQNTGIEYHHFTVVPQWHSENNRRIDKLWISMFYHKKTQIFASYCWSRIVLQLQINGTYETNGLQRLHFFSFQISSNLFKLLYLSYIFILGYLRSLFVKEIVLLLSVWLKRSDVQQKMVFHCLFHIKKDSAGTKGSGIWLLSRMRWPCSEENLKQRTMKWQQWSLLKQGCCSVCMLSTLAGKQQIQGFHLYIS